jgi:hypothetical protein
MSASVCRSSSAIKTDFAANSGRSGYDFQCPVQKAANTLGDSVGHPCEFAPNVRLAGVPIIGQRGADQA